MDNLLRGQKLKKTLQNGTHEKVEVINNLYFFEFYAKSNTQKMKDFAIQ